MTGLSMRRLAAVGLMTAAAGLSVATTVETAAASQRHHASAGAKVRMASSKKYGPILVSSSGRTLYVLVGKSGMSLPCKGACTSLWPPLLTSGKPQGIKGLATKLLGTVKHGGKLQVTYAHHPLFLYAGDSSKGQTNGEGIVSFGGTWYVLSAHGKLVKSAHASSGNGTNSGSGSGGSGQGGSGTGGGSWG